MSSEPQKSPYDVLGLPRDADARAIKKAYFERVRQHPPETFPEEFRRLREAYELLSDPEARQAWDASHSASEEGPEAARLREAIDLFNADDKEAGRAVLTQLLAEQPGSHEARDLLGRHFLFEGRPQEALAEFDLLVAQRPEDWEAHLHRGWALHQLQRLKDAADAFWRAGKLGPAQVGPRIALAECLEELGQVGDALGALAEAQGLPGVKPMDVLALKVRRAAMMLHHGRDAEAKRELDGLEAAVPRDADQELRRWTGGRLAAAAANLFAQQKSEAANRLLERSRRINPDSATEVAYPVRVTVDVDALPEPGREWLEAEAERLGGWRTLGTWAWPAILTFSLAVATLLSLAFCFLSPDVRGVFDWVGFTVIAAGLSVATVAAARAFLRAAETPFGKFTTIHPLHLVQVTGDRLIVWPFVHLQDVKLLNHQNNGVYSHTSVQLRFSQLRLVVPMRGEEKAELFAQELLGRRRRVLELLNRGMLDAESGVEQLPATLLARGGSRGHVRAEGRARFPVRGMLAAAAGAALVVALSVAPHARAVDENIWGLALNQRDLGPTLAYLRDLPEARFAPRAQARVDAELSRARERLTAGLDPGSAAAPSVPFFADLLEAVARDHSRRVVVEWTAADAPDALPEGFTAKALAAARSSREEQLVAAWQRRMDEALGQGVLLVDAGRTSPREGPPLRTLRVQERLRSGAGATPVEAVWSVTVTSPGSDAPILSLELAVPVSSPADPHVAEALFRAWVDRWHLPGTGNPRPLLLTASTLAQEATP
ncbi:hypothetical protein D7V97_32425 [Corallococcus sp. CA053C]|uniref:J domain-containing protein n=1 Tax=Corallococcus sp. CA053C TaxID=2316732 RepID=UPI000EA16CD0|nr:J domain-containing protein [Corallococcus sp. CA053C]RKG98870.1 hypothetical protein D7V97_32425 [Corallococcus sp. CA053C]